MRKIAFVLGILVVAWQLWRDPIWSTMVASYFYFAIPQREFYVPSAPLQAGFFFLAMVLTFRTRKLIHLEARQELTERLLATARDALARVYPALRGELLDGARAGESRGGLYDRLLARARVETEAAVEGRAAPQVEAAVREAVLESVDAGAKAGIGEVVRITSLPRAGNSAHQLQASINDQAAPALERIADETIVKAVPAWVDRTIEDYQRANRLDIHEDHGPLGMPMPRRALFGVLTNAGIWAHLGFTAATYICSYNARWSVQLGLDRAPICWLLFIPLLGIISQVRDARRLRMFLWAWMAGVGHIAYNGVTMWLSKGGRADDVGGQAGDANWLAMICVCVAPLALAMFIVEKKPLFRWGGLGAAGFYAMGVIASGSRGGLLALILGVGIWFVQTNKKGIAAGIMALAVGGFLLVAPESFWERMGTMFLGAENNPWIAKEHEASAQSRKIFWKLALTVFEESPFLGIGPMNIPEEAGERVWFIDPATGGTKYMTHNTWLQLLAEYGLFGSTFWIGGYLLSLWCVFRASMIAKQKLKDDPNYYWMPMYCVGLFAGWVANALAITFVSCQWLDYNYWIIVTGPLVLQIVRESAARSEWFGQRAPEAPAHAVAKRAARPMPVRAG